MKDKRAKKRLAILRINSFPAQESMNPFILDELFPMEGRKVLLLKFEEKTPGHYLNDSMVRFAVSQIQTEIGEYRCVGVIVPREEE